MTTKAQSRTLLITTERSLTLQGSLLVLAISMLGPVVSEAQPVVPIPLQCNVEPRSDGCSTPVWTPYNDRFERACGLHDRCYATLGMSKGRCDGIFLERMNQSCDTLSFLERVACEQAAGTFYTAVALAGDAQESYDNGQSWAENHCDDDSWSELQEGDADIWLCPEGQVMVGQYHIGGYRHGYTSYHCAPVPGFETSDPTLYFAGAEKDSPFDCPPDKVIVGRIHYSTKNGPTYYYCSSLVSEATGQIASFSQSISATVIERRGETVDCLPSMVMTGRHHFGGAEGDTTYRCALVFAD